MLWLIWVTQSCWIVCNTVYELQDGHSWKCLAQISVCFIKKKIKHGGCVDPSVFTFRHLFSSCAEQFSLTKRKKTSFPLDHTDCCADFDWLHQSLSGYSGAGDSEVSLSRSLWQTLLWMEEWPLSVWVSPRGQLGEIIRQDSYRQTDAVNWSCCSLTQTGAHLQESLDDRLLFSTSYKFTFGTMRTMRENVLFYSLFPFFAT